MSVHEKPPEDTTILIVDDNRENIYLLEMIISEEGYRTQSARSAQEALDHLERQKPKGKGSVDLVITDIMMPIIDGLELTRRIKTNEKTRHVPVMMLTAKKVDHSDIAKGLELGADDFLGKPVNHIELMARVKSLLRTKRLNDLLSETNDRLEKLVAERTKSMMAARDAALFGFARLAEYRDPETGEHLERIRGYTRSLAEWLQENGPYQSQVDDEFISWITLSSPLHDIGKVGIPDNVLLKPGKLTPEEFEIMKTHATIGGDTLAAAERRSSGDDNFLAMGRDIAYFHHEKWSGGGYPEGRKGEDIPLAARIMTVADIYDALVSKRVYKEAFSHEKAREIIISERGAALDPVIVDGFIALENKFVTIKKIHEDPAH